MKSLFAITFAAILLFHMQDQKDAVSGREITEAGKEKPLFSFGLISDVQYADIPHAGERYYRSSLDKLDEALSSFRKDSVDFIINLGDLIERDYESFKPVLNAINSSGIKTYHITGNHDYAVDPRYLNRLPVLSESRQGYYSVRKMNYRFVFLNGNEISTYASTDKVKIKEAKDYLEKLKSKGEINAIEWNGGIGSEQQKWIISQIEEASRASERVVFLCHFPVAPENIHNLLNYKEVRSLLPNSGNMAWLSGHNHEGNYEQTKNGYFVTFRGMVETKKNNSYAIIDVYTNKLIINGYGREASTVLTF